MKLPRTYRLEDHLQKNKVLVLYGPRQVGKTTLLGDFLQRTELSYKLATGDNIKTQELFSSQNLEEIIAYAKGYELIAIDEAQKIPHIGQGLKILVDYVPGIRIIATGSSSFELAGQIGEPLTGRKNTLRLFPVSQSELKMLHNDYELREKLEDSLLFGGYPEILTTSVRQEKINRLDEIAHSYLLKDILELEKVKSARLLLDLLRLLAFQIGSEVSLNELSNHLNIDGKTVARYLDLFEKAFIIFNIRAFSRNLRKEISKKSKYYFYDNGIRNALISNFNSLDLRNDVGALWENFLFIERLKKRTYQFIGANMYFWRTWDKKEIDLVEEREGRLFGYEFKWRKKNIKAPKDWLEKYPESSFEVISKDNYLPFIT